jgi:hypothetical protein
VDFENNYNQVEGSQVSQEDKQKLHQQMVTFFLGHVILVKVLEDINKYQQNILTKKG